MRSSSYGTVTALADANGIFVVYGIPSGTYTLWTGPNQTGPWTQQDSNYVISIPLKTTVASDFFASNPPSGAVTEWGAGRFNVQSPSNPSGAAKGNAQKVTDGAMTSGQKILTSASGLFQTSDVGKLISVANALSAINGPGSGGSGTITGYTSATQVTVSFTCANTVSAAEVTWGVDDTASIQAAINAAQSVGGGTVVIPPGTYIVQPSSATSDHALQISGSNISIVGYGRDVTRLWFRVYNFQDPKTNWQSANPYRGYGIKFLGGPSLASPTQGVILADFEFDGDAGYSGTHVIQPPTTGDGWDVTHKCLARFDTGGTTYNNIHYLRCHFHAWKGEIVYSGGSTVNLGNTYLYDCEIHDTNGDCVSEGAALWAKRNHVYKCGSIGFENVVNGVGQHLTDNWIHDCDLDGISAQVINASGTGPWFIEDNRLQNCQRSGISGSSLLNAWIRRNELIDCGWAALNQAAIYLSNSTNSQWSGAGTSKSVHVTDNEMFAHTQALNGGIFLSFTPGAGTADEIEVDRNWAGSTSAGLANGKVFSVPYQASGTVTNSRLKSPYAKGTTFNYTDKAYAFESLLTTTVATDVVKLRPAINGAFRVGVAFRVAAAATIVTVQITYFDAAGTQQTITLVSAVSEPVGSYQFADQIVAMTSANEAQYIKVTVTAGTANQVFVTASIQEAQ